MNRKDRRRQRGQQARPAGDNPAQAAGAQPGGRDLRAFVERFPRPSPLALGYALASALCANAWLWWLHWRGALSLSAIVLLIFVEAMLLSLIAAAQRARVPPAHRMKTEDRPRKPGDRLLGWLAALLAIGGAYAMWALVLKETELAVALLTSPRPWLDADLHIALGITLAFSVPGLLADQRHYRQAGPPLVSSVELEASARRITLVYGAVVIALPMFGLCAAAFFGLRALAAGREGRAWNALFGLGLIGAFFGSFALVASLAGSGPPGWAAVYLLGKTLVDGLFVLMPVLARKAAAKDAPLAPATA